MNILKPSILILACTSLAACSSSGSDSTSAASFASQFATTKEDTAEKALKSDTPLEAGTGSSVGLNVTFGDDKVTVAREDGQVVKITANDEGGYELQVGDRKISFALTDIDPENQTTFVKRITSNGEGNAQNYFLWNVTGNADELLAGDDDTVFHRVIGFYLDPDRTGPDVRGYAIVGTETPSDVIADSEMQATYEGGVNANIFQKSFEGNTQSAGRTRLSGDLTMNADFANNKISGSITNLETRAGSETEWTAEEGSVTMKEANITGNHYQGNFSSDLINGEYTGRFYGNAAQETAGTLTGEGEIDGVDHVGSGAFSANKVADPS